MWHKEEFTSRFVDGHMKNIAPMLRSGFAFTIVSTAAFAVWALGGKWFHHHGGELAMYGACCAVFVLLSGLLLRPALAWRTTTAQFYRFFIGAFLAYAVVWCAAWFWLGAGRGEWIASLAGAVAFTSVMAAMSGHWRSFLPASVVMFVAHSAGYFAGEYVCYTSLHSTGSELAWGALYGLGFGAGIGYASAIMPSPWTPSP